MSWLVANAGTLSDLLALLASFFLFIPLIALNRLARQFKRIGRLADREGVERHHVELLRQQIVDERFSDGQTRWLIAAGICFAMAFVCFALSLA